MDVGEWAPALSKSNLSCSVAEIGERLRQFRDLLADLLRILKFCSSRRSSPQLIQFHAEVIGLRGHQLRVHLQTVDAIVTFSHLNVTELHKSILYFSPLAAAKREKYKKWSKLSCIC